MNPSSRILLTLAVLLVAGTPVFAQQRPGRQRGDLRMAATLRVGDPAPEFKLKTRDGSRQVTLSEFHGVPVFRECPKDGFELSYSRSG
jgi:hypothetical protein